MSSERTSEEQTASTGAMDRLSSIIREMRTVIVAYSGGVDSTLLLHACLRTLGGDSVKAVVADHPLLREGEAAEAAELARNLGAAVDVVSVDPLKLDGVSGNPVDRCYHCKKYIFSQLREKAEAENVPWILDGTNADDAEGYRPGGKALEELGVRSPLREAGLTKDQVRKASRAEGLATWDKPAAPCLATRFPYDVRITVPDLERVKAAEEILRGEGFGDLRLRVHGPIARIEVPLDQLASLMVDDRRQRLVAALKSLGYGYITLDLEGLRSGSMDESLADSGSPE